METSLSVASGAALERVGLFEGEYEIAQELAAHLRLGFRRPGSLVDLRLIGGRATLVDLGGASLRRLHAEVGFGSVTGGAIGRVDNELVLGSAVRVGTRALGRRDQQKLRTLLPSTPAAALDLGLVSRLAYRMPLGRLAWVVETRLEVGFRERADRYLDTRRQGPVLRQARWLLISGVEQGLGLDVALADGWTVTGRLTGRYYVGVGAAIGEDPLLETNGASLGALVGLRTRLGRAKRGDTGLSTPPEHPRG